jgi:hypothetical protein
LEVAEFHSFHGHDHEKDFLKLLFGSAQSLKTMIIQHFNEVVTTWLGKALEREKGRGHVS